MTTSNDEDANLILGYWKIRGLAQPIRYLLHYTGTPYSEQFYEFGSGPEFSRDSWLVKKYTLDLDFPNLPYLKDKPDENGDVFQLTQSRTILRYLGRRLGFIGSTPKENSLCDMLLDQLHDLRMEFNIVCYNQVNNEDFQAARINFCSKILPRYLGEFETFLNKWTRPWLIGDQLTIADFQFFEYLDQFWLMCDTDDTWSNYPLVRALMKRVRYLPELEEYFTSDTFGNLPVNAKMARFGNEVVKQRKILDELC